MMRTLFVNPCLRPGAPHRYLPVGLSYVVTAAEEAGIEFDLLDIDINELSDQAVENYVIRNKYDVILVGSIVTHYKWVKWFTKMVKTHQPNCTVVIGNSVGSSIIEVIFHHTPADIVVAGEADVTVVELLRALEEGRPLGEVVEPEMPVAHQNGSLPGTIRGQGIEGLIFRDHRGRLVNTGKRKAVRRIDDLPFPNWDLFDVERYFQMARATAHDTTRFSTEEARVLPINTARGCVFKCSFCHYVFWDDPYRHRSPANVIAEMKRNHEKYGANYFNFWDELSFHKIKPAVKFIDALLEADLDIHFTASIRTDLLGCEEAPYEQRVELAEKMKRAGCLAVGYSLESANNEILAAMNKHVKGEYFDEQVRILRRAGIISNTSVIFGYPQETPDTIRQTIDACRQAKVYPSPGYLLPMPSTGMWTHSIENGFIPDIDQYLVNITERQDFSLNLTKMTDEHLKEVVSSELSQLATDLGLDFGGSMRTGGEAKHAKNQKVEMHRNVGETMNYANFVGSV